MSLNVKISLNNLAMLVILGSLAVVPLAEAQRPALDPADVFISADTDSFDPGLSVGNEFPPIRALYQGQEISEIDQFIRDKGAVFLAQRSVDW